MRRKQEDFYMISKAAAFLEVHPATLRRWEIMGVLMPSKIGHNGYRLYDVKELAGFKRRRKGDKWKTS